MAVHVQDALQHASPPGPSAASPTPGWLRAASPSASFAVRGAMASEIIPRSLWLGRGQFCLEPDLMVRAGITQVCC
jgi:hypothetical protein